MDFSVILNWILGGGLVTAIIGIITLKATVREANAKADEAKANAEKAVSALDGVEKVEIDLASGVAVVEGMVKDADVAKAVEALGFKIININK